MKKIALFDFCETLVNFQTGDRFVDFVREKIGTKKMHFLEKIRLLLIKLRFFTILGMIFPKNNIHKKIKLFQLKGFSKETLSIMSEEYYNTEIRPNLIKPLIQKLKEKQESGMDVIIVSGGFSIYILPFCIEFGISQMVATDIKFNKKEICLGQIKGIDCMHEEKITRLKEIIDFDKIDWNNSVTYSDSVTDLPILTIVGEGVVVSKNKSQDWVTKNNLKEIIW